MSKRSRLGEILVRSGVLDEGRLEQALEAQCQRGGRLGTTLVELGLIEEQELVTALSRSFGVPAVQLVGKRIDPEVLELLPLSLARSHGCVPLFRKREAGVDVLYLGMEDPGDLDALDDVSFRTGLRVRPVMVAPTELRRALERERSGPEAAPGVARPLAEMPLDAGDTVPDLSPQAGLSLSGVHAPETSQEASAPASRPEASDTPSRAASEKQASQDPEAEQDTHRVPTRTILQAVTQILIDKGLVTRDELLARLQEHADEPQDS